jgi:Na+/H+ antiporter NhaD/arsenite permease-like protein
VLVYLLHQHLQFVVFIFKKHNENFLFLFINKKSGLSNSVAEAFRFLTDIPRAALILITIVISGLFTEVTSNLSTATIFLPILDSVVCLNISF